ncbi:MAG: peptidyl-prolyl cis-trans isomerase [Planctomycetes bacterium]|nr:peptidyl-prolyl cis-trans isomerase [Planctomycetota bacterium]MCC7398905.1 peptidyl-prolyl cis-trans isomerase [Planctomycetota bacterium]
MQPIRMSRAPLLAVVVALAATGFSFAQEATPEQVKAVQKQVDQLSDRLVEERTKLLSDLRVNGVRLDPREVMREAVYLTGGKLVEAKVATFFILEEVKKQLQSGVRKPEEFEVSEQDVLDQLAPMRAEFETKNPGVDFWEVVRSQYGLSRETFLDQRKEAILFDRVFFPGAPKDWPDITKEAIKAQTQSDQGPRFLEQLEKATEGTDDKGNAKKLPDFWINMMRTFVQKGLRSWSDIRYASHGLPAETVLKVNDLTWSTQDAFDFVKKGLFVQDLERAIQEVCVREALRQELAKNSVLISDEEFQRRYDEYRQPYDSTPFTVEVIATRFKGYPCLEAFRARWRLITSYADLIKDEINDENLQQHADKRQAFFADGQVDVTLLPFQARSPRTGAWEPDGLAQAKVRCDAAFERLEKKELTFDQMLDKHVEFFANDEKRGRLGMLPLNQLRQQLRESEFTQLLDGFSLAEFLFFEAEVGKTIGPIQGPDGWFIARVNSRTPPHRKIDVKVQRERDLVREDYITCRFLDWARGVIGKAKFE